MIGYAMLGANDLDRAGTFYAPLVAMLGGEKLAQSTARQTWFGVASGATAPFAVVKTWNAAPATAGNGGMLSLVAPSREVVRAVYARALELGAADEGLPALRGPDPARFYGTHFRDLDGNKICVYHLGAA